MKLQQVLPRCFLILGWAMMNSFGFDFQFGNVQATLQLWILLNTVYSEYVQPIIENHEHTAYPRGLISTFRGTVDMHY